MKTPEEKDQWSRNGALAILATLAVMLIIILSSCASQPTAKEYHRKLQKEATYENRMKALDTFEMESLKEDNAELKRQLKELGRPNRAELRKRSLKEENAELRKLLEEAKKAAGKNP